MQRNERNGTQRKGRKEGKERKKHKQRNEMTSLLDKPITAASDDGVCRWHAVADTREIIEIKFHLNRKLRSK